MTARWGCPLVCLYLALLGVAAPAQAQWPDPARLDNDADEVENSREAVLGTNPNLADTDADGVGDLLDAWPLDPTRQDDAFALRHGARVSVPPPGLDPALGGTPPSIVRCVVQFFAPPTAANLATLTTLYGVDFHSRVPYLGYRAVAAGSQLAALAADPLVRAVRAIDTAQKMDAQLWIHGVPADARELATGEARFEISFALDVAPAMAMLSLVNAGGADIVAGPAPSEYEARFADAEIGAMVGFSIVQHLAVIRYDQVDLAAQERIAIGLDDTAGAPLFPETGAGVTVAQIDGGSPDLDHPELSTGVSLSPLYASPTESSHASLVAGVLTGNGVDALARGIAPDASVVGYRWWTSRRGAEQRLAEMVGPVNAALLAGAWGNALVKPGKYTSSARELDRFVSATNTAADPLGAVWAAGNGRGVIAGLTPAAPACQRVITNVLDPDYGEWDCIAAPATAKNALGVGAIQGGPNCATTFSAHGPTDDGRIKPDLVAPGRGVYSSTISGVPGTQGEWVQDADTCGARDCAPTAGLSARCNLECCDAPCSGGPLPECIFPDDYVIPSYDAADGTSMAAAVATGALAVLHEAWDDLMLVGEPRPATWKALLVETARDLENSGSGGVAGDGPSYSSGYGELDLGAALQYLTDHAAQPLLFEGSVAATGETRDFPFAVQLADVGAQFDVTLAWDDLPGNRGSLATLQHDFDLELIAPNGWVYHPWLLDPRHPGADPTCAVSSGGAATPGQLGACTELGSADPHDRRNNLEKVQVYAVQPDQIGTWTARVRSARMVVWHERAAVPSADFSIALGLDHPVADADGDGVPDAADNCPLVPNPDQADADSDLRGDVCDNCAAVANNDQANQDGDAFGDACDVCPADPGNDPDGDLVCAASDNCPLVANPLQENADGDAFGDVCDACPADPANDGDADGVCGDIDNCPVVANTGQENADGDAFGDACDVCPTDPGNDPDGDLVCAASDNCPLVANPLQENADGDALGDACDACAFDPANDTDADGVCGDVDNCPAIANTGQENADGDAFGDACDVCPLDAQNDSDADGLCADADNCPYAANPSQSDADADLIGDACQCGDNSDDGLITILDVVLALRAQALLDPALVAPQKAEVAPPPGFDPDDVVRLREHLAAIPLGPEQVCAAALPPPP